MLLQNKSELEAHLAKIDSAGSHLNSSFVSAKNLSGIVGRTWQIAQGMSEKVRRLDLEQSRVKQCAFILENIGDLKTCKFRAEQAVNSGDLDLACMQIAKYLEFDLETIDKIYHRTEVLLHSPVSFSNISPSSDEGLMGPSPVSDLKKLHGILTARLVDEFEKAVANDAYDQMIKVFKLFPKIGRGFLGLDRFSAYISSIVSNHCKKATKEAIEKRNYYL